MEQSSLPKNIRQIGQADPRRKIYIEDYVITFARKLAEKNRRDGMAVLLGEPAKMDKKQPVFIKGAVEVSQWDESQPAAFTNEMWSDIYEGVRKYFLDLEIVGWLLLRCSQPEEFDEQIKQIHRANFGETGNVLFVFDREEREENFYRFENGQFVKQPGYYIYYEKNEPMQEYMIDLFGNKSQEAESEDKVMEQVRDIVSNKESYQGKKIGNFVYAAGTALAAVVLVTGVTTLNNYDKVENIENTLNNIFETIEDEGTDLVVETLNGSMEEEMEAGNSGEGPTEEEQKQEESNLKADDEKNMLEEETEDKEKEEDIENKEDVAEEDTEKEEDKEIEEKEDTENKEEKESEETMADVKYYIVKKGDTLLSISGAIYGSDEYVAQIQEMNHIDNKDMIYEGQKLIIP